ncbi:hypothetical protein D3C87_1544100 [compost metagenome]
MCARDAPCRIASEIDRGGRHFVYADEFLGRLQPQHHLVLDPFLADALFACLIGNLPFDQRRQHEAGADRVDGDVFLRKLQRRRLGQAHDAMLGGHISRLERGGDEAVGGGDVDDPALACGFHQRDCVAHRVEGR